MAVTEQEFAAAEERTQALRAAGFAVSARYDRRRSRVVVQLNTGLEVTFPVRLAEGLAGAAPDDLAEIEVTPAGLGLHWPKLDADLYVPALLRGVFGTKRWTAAELERRASTDSDGNGRTDSRPAKTARGQGRGVLVR